MSNISKINDIPFLEVLSALWFTQWVDYKVYWDSIKMKDWWKITDWWNGSISWWFLKCHSWLKPWRIEWDRLSLVKSKFNLSTHEAISWYEDKFKIPKEGWQEVSWNNPLRSDWQKMTELTSEQKKYLASRGIDKTYAKNNNGRICLPLETPWWTIVQLQSRLPSDDCDKKDRFRIKWKWSWLFHRGIDPEKKVLYVVEWFTDFQTIWQFDKNVVGIVSAVTWIEELKAYASKHTLIYIPDKDESWNKSLEKFRESGIKFGYFDLNKFDDRASDLNEAWMLAKEFWISGEDFLYTVFDYSSKPLSNIERALQRAIRNSQNVWWLTWDKIFDWSTWGITPWTTFLINWASSQGKTATAMWILMCMLKHKLRVWFFSMETDTWKMLAQVLWYSTWKNWKKEIYPKIEKELMEFWIEKLDNLFLYDEHKTLEDIEQAVIDDELNVVFIDYAQIVHGLPWRSLKEKMEHYSKAMQHLSKKHYFAPITLSQIPKHEENEVPVLYRTPMESNSLKQASDTMINVGIYKWEHKMAFVKCKEWDDDAWRKEYITMWDKKTWKIKLIRNLEDIADWNEFDL